jgi:hypothetical protein
VQRLRERGERAWACERAGDKSRPIPSPSLTPLLSPPLSLTLALSPTPPLSLGRKARPGSAPAAFCNSGRVSAAPAWTTKSWREREGVACSVCACAAGERVKWARAGPITR